MKNKEETRNKLNYKKKMDQMEFFNGEYNGWWYYQYFTGRSLGGNSVKKNDIGKDGR